MKELGNKIREARIARKITPEALYERTRISVQSIKAIEAGEAGHLPEAYFRAFVRTMAKEVALDPDALLGEYDARQQKLREEQEATREKKGFGSNLTDFWVKRKKGVLILSICIFFVVLAGLYLRFGKELFYEPEIPETSLPMAGSDSTAFLIPDSRSFVLQTVGLEESWIEVRIDSGMYEDVFIQKDEKFEWQVEESIFVGLENPGSIRLSVNGEPLEEGEGELVSGVDLWITVEGIVKRALREKEVEEAEVEEADVFSPPVLVGSIDERELIQKLPVYAQNRDRYQPNSLILSRIEELNPSLSLVCFLGTWDPLSQEIVPELLRILQMSYLPGVSVSLVGVDRELKDENGLVKFHRIQGVPTILFLSRGHELGRIVGQLDERIEVRVLEIAEKAKQLLREDGHVERDSLHENGGNGERFHRFR